MNEITEAVREHYATRAAEIAEPSKACCDDGCCASTYSADELASIGLEARASLGCGNPTLLADLRPGETVLDLGSGAGIDVLLSARRVAPGGHAYGVDMTDEMLALARKNQARAGVQNATFLRGTIDSVPLPDASVDAVISNCVINLATDKPAVLREAHRLLRPGGRFAVADMLALAELPADQQAEPKAWASCIAGAITIDAYTGALQAAGFTNIDIELTDALALDGAVTSAYIKAEKASAMPYPIDRGCALDERELETRRTEWAALNGARESREEHGEAVVMTYRASADTRAELTRLVAAENVCCADTRWTLRDEGERLRVEIAPR